MRESFIRVPAGEEYLPMRCRCCDAERVRLVIDLGEQPLCNRLLRPETPAGAEPVYPLRLGYCENCTMMQIDHTIPRDDMYRDYVYVSGTTDTLRRHFAETTERLAVAYSVQRDDLVVDIGSNDGTWLQTWRGRADALGVEPATKIAEKANLDGLATYNAYFDAEAAAFIKRERGAAKLITSAGSFFHMEDLHGACEGVRELLADDGVFVCQAISGDAMIGGNAFDQVLHEHLLYYTLQSFAVLMERHGLMVFDLKRHPIHGGTLEYHVCKMRARGTAHSGALPMIFPDCEAFAQRILKLRADLLRVLHEYRAAGKSVWAYGAPGKGATLLNSFGIGPDLVQCAIEKNPLKHGLLIPGCRIPIIPEGGPHPDAYLVLAWNFLPEFMAKEAGFLNSGGEFIVPVPEVTVIGRQGTRLASMAGHVAEAAQ